MQPGERNNNKKLLDGGYSTNSQTGKAAEHLVCADLILQGIDSFMTDEGCPFDIVAIKNNKLYRVSVKACEKLIENEKCYH